MPTVFLSHSSADLSLVEILSRWLTRNGFTDVFIDRDQIKVGDRWTESLRNAKASCRIVLCLVTPMWLESDECFGEFMAGWYAGRRIMPLLALGKTALNERQERRLTRLLGEDQGFDLSVLGAPDTLELDSNKDVVATLIAGLKAGGALSHVGLDPFAFEVDLIRRPDPFPGLESFGDEDADAAIFFGRSTEIATCIEDLREMRASGDRRAYAILGASGSGKSSILKAGILPRIRRERGWVALRAFRPGSDPLFSFAESLSRTAADGGMIWAPGTIHQELLTAWRAAHRVVDNTVAANARDPERYTPSALDIELIKSLEKRLCKIREATNRSVATCLVSIDQAEELVRINTEASSALGDYIAAMLSTNAAEGGAIPYSLAFTIRDDSFTEFRSSEIAARIRIRTTDIRPLPIYRFAHAIENPAERYGVIMEPTLVHALIEDAPETDALPLLAFALRRLWVRFSAERRINRGNYELFGKLPGLLEDAAERALRGMDPRDDSPLSPYRVSSDREKRAAHIFVPGLAQVNDQGQPIRRLAPWTAMTDEDREILAPFNRWRLVVIRGQVVEVSHEALFREWPRFTLWLQPEKERLDTLRGAESAADSWNSHNKKAEYLIHRGERLSAAEALWKIEDYRRQLESSDFVAPYLSRCRASERHRRASWASLVLLLSATACLLGITNSGSIKSALYAIANIQAALPGASFASDAISDEYLLRTELMRSVLERYLVLALDSDSPAQPVNGSKKEDALDAATSILLKTRAGKATNDPWSIGQIAAALSQGTIDSTRLESYFRATYQSSCGCWSPIDGDKHLGATAWIVLGHAKQGVHVDSGVIQSILGRQSKDGGWPLFFDAVDSRQSNSSYATALLLLTLHELSSTNFFDPTLRKAIRESVSRARSWLHNHAPRNGEEWIDYPDSEGRKVASRGISAFVTYVLLYTGDTEKDQTLFLAWFDTIPEAPTLDQMDTSDQFVTLTDGQVRRDGTRYLILGWELASISRGASNLGALQRIKARRFFLDTIEKWPRESTGRFDFLTAETLYAVSSMYGDRRSIVR